MFRQQPASRSVHPYQTTIVPRSNNQHEANTLQRTKYPWLDDTTSVSVSYTCAGTDSSNSEHYNMPHYSNTHECVEAPSSPVYHSPYSDGEGKWPSAVRRPPEPDATYNLPPTHLPRSTSPPQHHYTEPVLSRTPDPPAIGGCGGHCPGFEYICYYVLQIMFVVGILTGISLCLAGAVLKRSNRGGDLGVLVYIGCLSSLVCGVLLGVQYCVRRDLRRRKRHQPHLPVTASPTHTVPLNAVSEWSAAVEAGGDRNTLTLTQLRPLLQNPSTISHHSVYKPTVCPNEEVSGIPWWRRQN